MIRLKQSLEHLLQPQLSFKSPKLIEQYIHSISSNNLKQQYGKLQKIYQNHDDNTKLQCLNIMLNNYLSNPNFINFYDLNRIIKDFNILKFNNKPILQNLSCCLYYCYKNVNKLGENKSLIVKNIKSILEQINYKDLELEMNRNFSPVMNELLEEQPQRKQLINDRLDFDGLCKYINQPYKNLNKPLFEYYDSLNEVEQKKFMEDYLEYNKTKQNNIELQSLNLPTNLYSPILVYKFGQRNAEMIDEWLKFSQTFQKLDPNNEDDKIILSYDYWLKIVGYKEVTNLILASSFSLLISNESGKITLAHILKNLSDNFKKILKSKMGSDIPIKDDEFMILFSAIFKKIVDYCKVDIPDSYLYDSSEMFKKGYKMNSLFTHNISRYGNKTIGKIFLNPYIHNKFQHIEEFHHDTFNFPMIYPPKPWKSPDDGGYLNNLKSVVFHNSKNYVEYLKPFSRSGQLDFIYSNLNYMSSTPWCIDVNMKNVLNEVIEFNKGFINIPGSEIKSIPRSKLNQPLKTMRSKYERTIQIMNAFNDNIIYFPHAVDFRSRCYPMVSHLSYQDEDLIRSILQFWEAKPIGENGFDWIKYQAAGLYGLEKLGFDERVKFVNDNLENILNSAANPINYHWWKDSDKPWQFLRHCFEISNILSFKGELKTFKSRLPIHLDGSCNGLQHYAALGRDSHGGKAVNLIPTGNKEDVYTEVLNFLITKLTNSYEDEILKKILSRKIVKRPIMTSVYGVTVFGGVRQMEESLGDLNLDKLLTREQLDFYEANKVQILFKLSKLIVFSLSKLFENAKIIQIWLLDSCKRILTSIDKPINDTPIDFNKIKAYKPMMWTTLTGFPVIQTYLLNSKRNVSTALQYIQLKKSTRNIDTRKQHNSIVPNFIHSLDATHLLLTCNTCQNENVPFVAVHDSFWTSPQDVDKLNKILRQEFVNLYQSDILGNLLQDLQSTVNNSYHLVYFDKSHKELYDNISAIREGPFNQFLNKELRDDEKLRYINELVEQYKPELWFRSGNGLINYYGKSTPPPLKKDCVPILIKAQLLSPPVPGDYNLEQVKHSKYFFA